MHCLATTSLQSTFSYEIYSYRFLQLQFIHFNGCLSGSCYMNTSQLVYSFTPIAIWVVFKCSHFARDAVVFLYAISSADVRVSRMDNQKRNSSTLDGQIALENVAAGYKNFQLLLTNVLHSVVSPISVQVQLFSGSVVGTARVIFRG